MKKILIAGGTGLVGSRLSRMLVEKGYEIIILTRKLPAKPQPAGSAITYALWDVAQGTIDRAALSAADYIINLAGAGVAEKRWTAARKQEIVDSRVQSCALLVKALQETHHNRVKAVLCASAAGYYGPDQQVPSGAAFRESDPPATDFLGTTCRLWEASIEPVTALGKRLVKFRTGIVLSNDGAALAEFKKPLRFGLATTLGKGTQVVSWIHIEDFCRFIIMALEEEALSGAYNTVAPEPVSNRTLITTLARLRGKFYLPVRVPAFVLKLALGEMSVEVLKSVTLSAKRVLDTGFQFNYPDIQTALEGLREEEIANRR